jgi:glycerophosphoryl diester phosphodiesterase
VNVPALNILAKPRPLVIGHRGYCHIAPENTLPSFKLALAAQVDLVEMDIHQSRDGELMVIHDAEFDRTTDAKRHWRARHIKVASRTAAEIQALDAGIRFAAPFVGTRVPTLREALDVVTPTGIALVERKSGNVADCVKLLREKHQLDRVIIQSFDWHFLRLFHELEPHAILGALGPARRLPNGKRPFGIARKLNTAWLNQAHKTGARAVVWTRLVSKGAIRLAHERGFKVWVYTVNDPRLAKRLLHAGVDGFITNNPPVIRGLIEHPAPRSHRV